MRARFIEQMSAQGYPFVVPSYFYQHASLGSTMWTITVSIHDEETVHELVLRLLESLWRSYEYQDRAYTFFTMDSYNYTAAGVYYIKFGY